jgi:hypothetical protein
MAKCSRAGLVIDLGKRSDALYAMLLTSELLVNCPLETYPEPGGVIGCRIEIGCGSDARIAATMLAWVKRTPPGRHFVQHLAQR